ncbi:MAG: thermonuclease family protein [Kiritimatiellia bacterium]
MKRILLVVFSAGCVFAAEARTVHRSFRPTAVGTGGGTAVIVPGFAQRTGSQFQKSPSPSAPKKSFVGTVTQVADGDTIWVTPNGGAKKKVQLIRINAPELGQPFGEAARKYLTDLILGKKVEVQYTAKDRTGCLGGVVFLPHEKGVVDVNLTMILNGLAWYDEAADPPEAYANGQRKAQTMKTGLWAGDNPNRNPRVK